MVRASILNNLGYAYDLLDNYEKASIYYLMSIKAMPERGYYGYINLAGLNYRIGKLKEAYEYSQQAKELVNSSNYEKMEKLSGGYQIDAIRNTAIFRRAVRRRRPSSRFMRSLKDGRTVRRAPEAGPICPPRQ